MLQNLNVVEILRLGLSGFCFLLSLLAFWLIRQEQKRSKDPRKGIVQVIYIFMAVNMTSALLVAGLGYLTQKRTVNAAEPLSAKTYLVENTSFLVDLTHWSAAAGGPAVIRRSDFVRKTSDTTADFVIPSYTTGEGIDWKPIAYSTLPSFTELHAPDQLGRHSYEYRLPIGRQPRDHYEMVSSEFTFPSGFKNPKAEWWKAYAPYPSKTLSVVIRFPPDKPCRQIKVSRQEGAKAPEPITDNLPLMSNGGQVVMWTGLDIAADTRIGFEWNWDQTTP
jgi:hypothetical protein